MTTGDRAPRSPLAALAHYWYVGVLLAIVGLAGGIAIVHPQAEVTTAETRISVGTGELAAYRVPGFALASQQLAANYARYLTSARSIQGLAPALGAQASKVESVSASPIPASSVFRIEVRATDPRVAERAADALAASLVGEVKALNGSGAQQTLLADYQRLTTQVSQAQDAVQAAEAAVAVARPVTAALRARLISARTSLAVLALQQKSLESQYTDSAAADADTTALTVVSPAVSVAGDKRSRTERYAVAGLALGLLAALVISVGLERRASTRRSRARHAGGVETFRRAAAEAASTDEPAAAAEAPSVSGLPDEPGWPGRLTMRPT